MVTAQLLEQLLVTGENQSVEFKSTIESAAKIAKTLVAFANTNGGTLLVGITDSGEIGGVQSEEQEIQKLEEASEYYCQPPLEVAYEAIIQTGKKVLYITIPESDQKPHTVRDKTGKDTLYVRMHDRSVPSGKASLSALTTRPKDSTKTLLQSQEGKALQRYLQNNEYITPKRFAKLINISERRAEKMLMDFADNHLILPVEQEGRVVYTQK